MSRNVSIKKEIRGYIHIHSNYSYDGVNSIAELSRFFKKKGYDFICLTEHADDFSQGKMTSYVEECRRSSSSGFEIIPGLEYRCKDLVHVMAIGVDQYSPCDDPQALIGRIKDNQGLAIIAHPDGYENNITRELIKVAHGIEIWNAQKDSRFIPNWKILSMYNNYRQINSTLIPVGGGDIHSIDNFHVLDTVSYINSNETSPLSILRNAKIIHGAFWSLELDSEYEYSKLLKLRLLRFIMRFIKSVFRR